MPTLKGGTVYTIGHSNRTMEELLGLLRELGVATLVDIRRSPWSRRHPHVCRPAFGHTFAGLRTRYVHAEALGGLRSPVPHSPNGALG